MVVRLPWTSLVELVRLVSSPLLRERGERWRQERGDHVMKTVGES